MSKVEQYITSIPDFPKEGIIFRDITTVLGDADGFHLAVDEMTALLDGVEFDAIAGLESRGFLFGAPMAYNLDKAFIPIRKQGKLPRATSRMSYEDVYKRQGQGAEGAAGVTGEMRTLLEQAASGDRDAEARLIEDNSGLIWSIVRLSLIHI